MSPKVYSFGDIIRLVKNNRLWYIVDIHDYFLVL